MEASLGHTGRLPDWRSRLCLLLGTQLDRHLVGTAPGTSAPIYIYLIRKAAQFYHLETLFAFGMRAFVINQLNHPSKIELTKDAPEPKLVPGGVPVDIYSAGLNFFDVSTRAPCLAASTNMRLTTLIL